MTKQEAIDYIKLVHDKVDGRHIKFDPKRGLKGLAKDQLNELKSRLSADYVPMPDYDHDRYLKAMTIISIHGESNLEPVEGLKEILVDMKDFFKEKLSSFRDVLKG